VENLPLLNAASCSLRINPGNDEETEYFSNQNPLLIETVMCRAENNGTKLFLLLCGAVGEWGNVLCGLGWSSIKTK
jgi:hypothetical protein